MFCLKCVDTMTFPKLNFINIAAHSFLVYQAQRSSSVIFATKQNQHQYFSTISVKVMSTYYMLRGNAICLQFSYH